MNNRESYLPYPGRGSHGQYRAKKEPREHVGMVAPLCAAMELIGRDIPRQVFGDKGAEHSPRAAYLTPAGSAAASTSFNSFNIRGDTWNLT